MKLRGMYGETNMKTFALSLFLLSAIVCFGGAESFSPGYAFTHQLDYYG
jgi:hypothetical protein